MLPQLTEHLDKRIRKLQGERQQIQERLKRTPEQKEIVAPARLGRAGNVRSYLNAPVRIPPPRN